MVAWNAKSDCLFGNFDFFGFYIWFYSYVLPQAVTAKHFVGITRRKPDIRGNSDVP